MWMRQAGANASAQRVLVVGASVSAGDMITEIADVTTDVHVAQRGKYNAYFGDGAFRNPHLTMRPEIVRIEGRTVFFADGAALEHVDHILFGTGFNWTLPFLPHIEVRNNRVPGLYQHIFHRADPTLTFIGAVSPPPPELRRTY